MIPKIIHQFWTPLPIPLQIAQMMETWRTHHPEWEFMHWSDTNLIPLVNHELYAYADGISPDAPEQFKSDVLRYEVLHEFGGVWVDADFICQAPLDQLLTTKPFAGKVGGRWLNNALIGSPPKHPMLYDLITNLERNVARHRPEQGNTIKSGPQYFTPIARKWKIVEYPEPYFYPFNWTVLDPDLDAYPDAFAIHLWGNQRRLHGMAWK